MAEKITGIVLNVRKYNDNNSIVTLYTRERGRLSFISANGSGKASNVRRARLLPLSVISTDLNFKQSSELQRLGSISPVVVWNDVYFHPLKRAQTIFLSEFLYRLLNETMSDERMFDFLVESFRLLDGMDTGIEDFQIPFLVSMLTLSGIRPDISDFQPGFVFEFASGAFVPPSEAKVPWLGGEEAKAVNFVCRINFSNMKKLCLGNSLRSQILYGLLNYFSYHFPGLSSLKSPEVIRELFE